MEKRPERNEYDPFFARYIDLVPNRNIADILEEQMADTTNRLNEVSEQQGLYKYDHNKWTVKEVIGHLTDGERLLGQILFQIARGEEVDFQGVNWSLYIQLGDFNNQSMQMLIDQNRAVRSSTVALLRSFNEEAWGRKGIAIQSDITVRALAWILAGHELHHRKVLEKYYFSKTDFQG